MNSAEGREQIVAKLGELHRKFNRMQSQLLERYHISLMEYHILALVLKNDNASQNDIAEALKVDKALVSRQIKAMEQKGLIVCRPDPECRRRNLMLPGENIPELMPALDELHRQSLERLFDGVDENELEIFRKVLEGLIGKA